MSVRDKHDDMIAARDEFTEAQEQFQAYAAEFAADVGTKLDVSHLLDAVDALRAEMDTTNEAFDVYAGEFAADAEALHDVSDLKAAIKNLQQVFAGVQDEFDDYAATFEGDIEQFHADMAAQRDAFDTTTDAFAAYREEFLGVDVQALLDAIEEFQREIDDFRAEFESTEEAFGAFIQEFYGPVATIEPEASEARSEPPQAEAVMTEDTGEPTAPEPETEAAGEAAAEQTPAEDAGAKLEEETPEDMVQCLVCSEYYKAITEPHLQTHDMTIQTYRDEYGEDVPLRPDDRS